MGTIQNWWLEIKRFLDTALGEWGMLVIIALVGLGAFGLGRLSVLSGSQVPVALATSQAAASSHAIPLGGAFVASKNGTTYYYPWCGTAQNIKPENQVWFATENAAQKAGYSPAKNCKGLEQ